MGLACPPSLSGCFPQKAYGFKRPCFFELNCIQQFIWDLTVTVTADRGCVCVCVGAVFWCTLVRVHTQDELSNVRELARNELSKKQAELAR